MFIYCGNYATEYKFNGNNEHHLGMFSRYYPYLIEPLIDVQRELLQTTA